MGVPHIILIDCILFIINVRSATINNCCGKSPKWTFTGNLVDGNRCVRLHRPE